MVATTAPVPSRSPERRPTRRDLLTTASLAAVAATVATLPAEEPDAVEASDAELLDLERRLDANLARLVELRNRRDELEETVFEGVRLGDLGRPAYFPAGGRPFCSEKAVAEARAEGHLTAAEAASVKAAIGRCAALREDKRRRSGLAALQDAIYALACENDDLAGRIAEMPARTAAGVAVKIRRLHACAVDGSDGFEDEYLATALADLDRLGGDAAT